MKPTVGRIVHYTNLGDADGRYPPEQQAAIVTRVRDQLDLVGESLSDDELLYVVDLHIFYPTGDFWMTAVPFSREYKRGHWSWPTAVPR